MKDLLNFGEMLSVQARLSPDRVGARDLERAMTLQRKDVAKQNASLKSGLEAKDLIFNNVDPDFQDFYACGSGLESCEIDHRSRAICTGASVSSSTNPETDTPSSLTAFFIGKSVLSNSAVTFAKSLQLPMMPATVLLLEINSKSRTSP